MHDTGGVSTLARVELVRIIIKIASGAQEWSGLRARLSWYVAPFQKKLKLRTMHTVGSSSMH